MKMKWEAALRCLQVYDRNERKKARWQHADIKQDYTILVLVPEWSRNHLPVDMDNFHLRTETKRMGEWVDKLAFRHLMLVIKRLLTIRKSLQNSETAVK